MNDASVDSLLAALANSMGSANINPLFELLAVCIGFAGVMLVLSLLVTTLVQATVGLFGLRGGNLRWGLSRLLETALQVAHARISAATAPNAKKSTAKRTNTSGATPALDPAALKEIAQELTQRVCSGNALLRPGVGTTPSWLRIDELSKLIEEAMPALRSAEAALFKEKHVASVVEAVKEWFPRMEDTLRQRFQFFTRCMALFWACVVAFVFQVSTPELLARLSSDPEFRARVVTLAEAKARSSGENIENAAEYKGVAQAALEELAKKFPQHVCQIEQASGIVADERAALDELRRVLKGAPDEEAVITAYQELLKSQYAALLEKAASSSAKYLDELASIDIRIWREGGAYYKDNPSRVLGVLMSALFLMLGAPFWFNMLRRLVNLRDALIRDDEDQKKKV